MNLISIITINLNNAAGLKNTFQSIEMQTFKNIELIVIDGCSQDTSIEVIDAYFSIISKSVIEKDNGLYDAMNKGIKKATGDFVIFLNSGDVFHNAESLMNITSKIDNKDKMYFGRAQNIYENLSLYLMPGKNITNENYQAWLKHATPCHQAILFPRSFYENNYYNLNFKICSDVDYKYRAINQCECDFIDSIVVNFELGGMSTVPNSFALMNKIVREGYRIKRENSGRLIDLNFIMSMGKQYVKYVIFRLLGEVMYFRFLKKKLG